MRVGRIFQISLLTHVYIHRSCSTGPAGFLHSPWRCTAIGQGETIARIDLRVNRTRVLSFALSN